MNKITIWFKSLVLASVLATISSSCAVTLPRFTKQATEVSVSNTSAEIKALARTDYSVLETTTGKASTTRCYFLFFPIGKHKTKTELYDNAYYEAVENSPDADALILPRQKIKKFTLPLLLFNFNKRTSIVTGVGISVKDYIDEKVKSDMPFTVKLNQEDSTAIFSKHSQTERSFPKLQPK